MLPVVVGTGDMNTSVTLDNTPPSESVLRRIRSEFRRWFNLAVSPESHQQRANSARSPDTFSFALATTGSLNLETNDPSGADYLFTVDLTGGALNFQRFTTAGTEITAAIEPAIQPIPEPAFGGAVAGLLVVMAAMRRFRRVS